MCSSLMNTIAKNIPPKKEVVMDKEFLQPFFLHGGSVQLFIKCFLADSYSNLARKSSATSVTNGYRRRK